MNARRERLILAALLLVAIMLDTAGLAVPASKPADLIPVTFPNGTRILVEIADSNESRARGLMFRDRLAVDRGMLFVFDEPAQWVFWMKNTKVPLDILWLSDDKRIVDIAEDVPGCIQEPCMQYQPSKDATYVLEVPAGSVKRLKLGKGMQLKFNLPQRQGTH